MPDARPVTGEPTADERCETCADTGEVFIREDDTGPCPDCQPEPVSPPSPDDEDSPFSLACEESNHGDCQTAYSCQCTCHNVRGLPLQEGGGTRSWKSEQLEVARKNVERTAWRAMENPNSGAASDRAQEAWDAAVQAILAEHQQQVEALVEAARAMSATAEETRQFLAWEAPRGIVIDLGGATVVLDAALQPFLKGEAHE